MYICDNPAEMTEQPQPQRTKVSVFSRIRRSFRRKKESYCINCGHVTKNCYHSKDIYENVEFNNKDDLLKWLDLDLSHGHGINNNPIRHKYQVTGLALFPSHKLFRFLSLSLITVQPVLIIFLFIPGMLINLNAGIYRGGLSVRKSQNLFKTLIGLNFTSK